MFNQLSLLLFSENSQKLSQFYEKVFGKSPDWQGGDFVGWLVGGCYFTIGPHDKVIGKNSNPERIIFNLETEHVDAEFERIKKLGAKIIADPYHPGESESMLIATFADPDNNYFQLVTPMDMEKSKSN